MNTFLIVFLVLALLLGAKFILPKYQTQKSSYLEKVASVQKDSIQRIELIKNTDKVDLVKESGTWKVNGKNADSVKINNLMTFLLTTNPPEEIAQTDKRHNELELTDDKALKIKLGDSLTFLVGKSTGFETYLRFEGNPTVYRLAFGPDISAKISDWYDTTVLSVDRAKLTKLTFRDTGTTALIKKDDKWVSEGDGKETNTEKMDGVLLALSQLTAQSLYDETLKTWYPTVPAMTLVVDYDGKSETLDFYKGENDYLVKRASDGERFIINESNISSLINARKEIF